MKRYPFRFWAVLAALVLLFGGQLYLVMTAPPEANARAVSLIRDTSSYIFWPVAMGITLMIGGPVLWILINQKRWSRMATSGNIRNAKKVALSLWRVDCTLGELKDEVFELEKKLRNLGYPVRSRKRSAERGMSDFPVVIGFRHLSWGRWKFTLPVRSGHPDIERFRRLKAGDTVEFEPLSEGMECALEEELCGYLRIKSIS